MQQAANIHILPLTTRIVRRLPAGLELLDGIIVASALELTARFGEECALLTLDSDITNSGLVKVVW